MELSVGNSYSSFEGVWDEWKNGDELARSMTPTFVRLLSSARTDVENLLKLFQEREKIIKPDSSEFVEIKRKITDLEDMLVVLKRADDRVNIYLFNQAEVKLFE